MDSTFPIFAVHVTGRLSAFLFVMALLVPIFSDRVSRRSTDVFLAFITAHTVHFAAVVWFAIANGGRNLFPEGRSLEDVGGWPTVLAIFLFFYVLAFIGFAARRVGSSAGRRLLIADRAATTLIGLQFLAVYIPLVSQSPWFVVPTVLLLVGLAAYLFGDKVRRLPCLACASGSA